MAKKTKKDPQGCCESCELVFDITEDEVERLKQPGAVLHCEACTDPSLYYPEYDFYGYLPDEYDDEDIDDEEDPAA